jgi:hypothetical protein
MKLDVWYLITAKRLALVSICLNIPFLQSSIMYTIAGDEHKCENKEWGSGPNFFLACLASSATHANRRCSESISD